MEKFEVGDIIEVIKELPQDKHWGIFSGMIGKIKDIDKNNDSRYIVDFLLHDKKCIPMIGSQMKKISSFPSPDNPQEIKFPSIGKLDLNSLCDGYIKVDSDGIRINNGNTNINVEKEKNNMEILNLYRERKNFKIQNDFLINKNKILEEDEIQKIFQDTENQVNVLLDKNECNAFKIGYNNIVSKETEKKLLKLEAERDKKTDQLHSDYEEAKALLSMTNDYQEQIKILKNYGIIDKKTNKLNV